MEVCKAMADKLAAAGIEDSQSDSKILFEYITGVNTNELYLNPDKELSDESVNECMEAVNKRIDHIPVQHITGRQEFMGLEFAVNEHVLIPRLDTEVLVEEAMRIELSHLRILDMCTGSGCILLSLLHYSHDCEGVGVDISPEALEVARMNADRLGIDAEFVLSDLFDGLKDNKLTYDLIVSNPPYIPTDVIPTLMEEVKEHEPILALDGSADGLDYYRRIISESPAFITKGGNLMFEIGYDQGEAVSGLMRDAGYSDVEVVKDLSGLDRVVRGRWEN
ncbi:MAG: peptide chain release factor N(5)-glutamine methyltransferase [Lachnospiraceae bacterium]|nr:peptide chain release factor N(5)-glutamine methyltransferase [Lachnospiraceae bacterium]